MYPCIFAACCSFLQQSKGWTFTLAGGPKIPSFAFSTPADITSAGYLQVAIINCKDAAGVAKYIENSKKHYDDCLSTPGIQATCLFGGDVYAAWIEVCMYVCMLLCSSAPMLLCSYVLCPILIHILIYTNTHILTYSNTYTNIYTNMYHLIHIHTYIHTLYTRDGQPVRVTRRI
jgi:hypothetical protein